MGPSALVWDGAFSPRCMSVPCVAPSSVVVAVVCVGDDISVVRYAISIAPPISVPVSDVSVTVG